MPKPAEEEKDPDTSINIGASEGSVQKSKNKQNETSDQPTLDKHLINTLLDHSDRDILRNLQDKIDNLASKEYIENKFKKMLTEDLLIKKIK